MKRYLIIGLITLAACNSGNQAKNVSNIPGSLVNNPRTADGMDTVSAARKPTMDFKDTLHEFGTIHAGEAVSYEFTFTNNGKTPLIISGATGSCGCTVPEFPHDPVDPGKSGVMKVTFNSSGKSGHQDKSVMIHTNTLRSTHMLYIKADIAKD